EGYNNIISTVIEEHDNEDDEDEITGVIYYASINDATKAKNGDNNVKSLDDQAEEAAKALKSAQTVLNTLQEVLQGSGDLDDTVWKADVSAAEKRIKELAGIDTESDLTIETIYLTKVENAVKTVKYYVGDKKGEEVANSITESSEIGKAQAENGEFLKLYNKVKAEYDAIATKVLAKGTVVGMALAVNGDNIIAKLYLKTEDEEGSAIEATVTSGGKKVTENDKKESIKLNASDSGETEYAVYEVILSPKDYEKAIEVKVGDSPVENYYVKDYLDYAETYLEGDDNKTARDLAVSLSNYCKAVKTYLAESASSQKSYAYYSGTIDPTIHKYKGSAIVITDEAKVELRNYYDINGTVRYSDNTEKHSLGSISTAKFTSGEKSTVKDYFDILEKKYGKDSSAYKVVSALLDYDKAAKEYKDSNPGNGGGTEPDPTPITPTDHPEGGEQGGGDQDPPTDPVEENN
ncbi:MAG: hypothetical protein K2K02_02005, partial [Ruminococcus sp.]|nr:hypothetical protein [Ruminococcus sp.]